MNRIIKECKPNPGSEEAGKVGCKCPVMDNEYGRGYPGGGFVINMECPIHSMEIEELKDMMGIGDECDKG